MQTLKYIKDFICAKSDDLAAFSGGGAGFVVGDATEPGFQALDTCITASRISDSLWTIFTMVVGGVLVFWAKKLCEIIYNKLFKKEK